MLLSKCGSLSFKKKVAVDFVNVDVTIVVAAVVSSKVKEVR